MFRVIFAFVALFLSLVNAQGFVCYPSAYTPQCCYSDKLANKDINFCVSASIDSLGGWLTFGVSHSSDGYLIMSSSFGPEIPPVFANRAFCSSNDTIAYCFQTSSLYYDGFVANGTAGLHITIGDELLSVPMLTFNIIPDPNNNDNDISTSPTKTGVFLDRNNIPTRIITKESSSFMDSLVSPSSSAASLSCDSMDQSCGGVAFSKLLDRNVTVFFFPAPNMGFSDFLALSTTSSLWSFGYYRSSNPQLGCSFESLFANYLNWPTSAPILCGHTLNKQWNGTSSTTGDLDTSVYINGKQQESIPFGSYQLDF